MINHIHTADARRELKKVHDDVQERWDRLEKIYSHMGFSNPNRKQVQEDLLELAFERRGVVAAIATINGLSVGLLPGAKVYNYRTGPSNVIEGTIVHPREVGGEYEDSTVDEWDIDDDFFEMIPVRWDGQESACWVYFEDLARVPEL